MHNRHLFALRMRLISDGLFFPCPTLLDYSTVGWTLQRRRRHIQRCCHKGQFAPGLFRVVGMFHPLILFVCMWMQFDSVGWTIQRRRRCIQRCRLTQRRCLSSQVLSHAHLQHGISECRGDSGGGSGYVCMFLSRTFIVVLVGVLVSCVPIPTSHGQSASLL